MPLVHMEDMLAHAYRHGYAVGAFGVAGWDLLEGVVAAAENMRAPIILSVSKYYLGTDNIESLLLDVAARRIRENALAGVEGYAATMEGVRDTVRVEAERCNRVWGFCGRAADVLFQCRLRDASLADEIDDTGKVDGRRGGKMSAMFLKATP